MFGFKTRFALISAFLGVGVGFAAGIAPCTDGVAAWNETIIPVRSSAMTYCVSDYGWSDSWFRSGTISSYNGQADVLSGDDALNLRWSGGAAAPTNGWLGPSLDADRTNTSAAVNNRGTSWTVTTPVHHIIGTSVAQSVISHASGLQIVLTTTVTGLRTDIRLDITNNGPLAVTNLQVGDYFRYHPNGSTSNSSNSLEGNPNASRNQGIVYYLSASDPRCASTGAACLFTQGNPNHTISGNPTFIGNGRMWGSIINGSTVTAVNPNAWRIGSASNFNPATGTASLPDSARVWQLLESNSYNNPAAGSSFGRGDAAGAFRWNLGNLAVGQTVSFLVSKEITDIPEPATLSFLIIGLGVLGLSGRRLRR